MRLRHSVRGLVVDGDSRLLLYRFTVPGGSLAVWSPPGGGIKSDEPPVDALARELDEETGLRQIGHPIHVWHQKVTDPNLLTGWDGVINDYYLIRTSRFDPVGSMDAADLAAELVEHFEWWDVSRLLSHRGPEVFGPRDLPTLYDELLRVGPPTVPVVLGL